MKGTGDQTDPGILRLDFPGFSGEESLRPLSWEEFFEWFDKNNLALIDRPADRFNKIVSRETVVARERGQRTSRRRTEQARTGQHPGAKTRLRAAASRKHTRAGAEAKRPSPAKKPQRTTTKRTQKHTRPSKSR